jgi:hypothetical protein
VARLEPRTVASGQWVVELEVGRRVLEFEWERSE